MTHTRDLRITCPDDLLAAVPTFFGFHPEDSVVVLTAGSAAEPFTARFDLPAGSGDVDGLIEDVRRLGRRQGGGAAAVVFYTDDAALAEAIADPMADVLRDVGVLLSTAIRADGDRWYCLVGRVGGVGADCPADGTPYDVSVHPIMVQSVVEGRVVHDSREALRDSLLPVDPDEVERVGKAMDVALDRTRAAGRHPLGPPDPAGVRRHLVQEGRWVQHRIRRFVRDRERLDCHDVGRLLVGILSVEVRDVAWAEMTREVAGSHVDLWRDVLRRGPLEALAAPGALLAFAAWLAGDGALAWMAVERSQQAVPDYSMAGVVAQALASATPPSTWQPLSPDALSLFAG